MILIDTNIIIDVSTNDPIWADWSQEQLDAASRRDILAINAIVYAELSAGFPRPAQVDALLARTGLTMATIPRRGLFLAGRAFLRYRQRGGSRTGVLADFFLGAHAVVTNSALITRDTARYLTYFPGIELIAPNLN